MKNYDFIVIGAGRASNFAFNAAKMGYKVAMIEKDKLGGTCPNKGCMPSKILLEHAHKALDIKNANKYFLDVEVKNIDTRKIFDTANKFIKDTSTRYEDKIKNSKIDLYRGIASFISDYEVKVGNEILTSKKIIIASGSRPLKALSEYAITSDDIFPFEKEVPKSIVIVGGGIIACEFGSFFSGIGVKTIQIVRGSEILKNEDRDIVNYFIKEHTKNVDLRLNCYIKNSEFNNGFKITLNDDSQIFADMLLYAIGRQSNADLLELHNTNIIQDDKGFIKRNEFLETNVKGIYAVGDISGKHMFQHSASYEVNYLTKILLKKECFEYKINYMPRGIFAYPEIASVGLNENEVKNLNIEYVSVVDNFLVSGKALGLKEEGKIKLIVDSKNYKILGASMVGSESTSIIHQILSIMNIDNDVRHLKNMMYIHPALNEGLLSASVKVIQKIRKINKN